MLAVAAIAAIAILPATGLAKPKQNDAKQDAALVKPIVKKIVGLTAGLRILKGGLTTAQSNISALKTSVNGLKTGLTAAQGDISTLKTDDASTQSAITTINAQLAAGATALTQINAALTNSTTGLVGLNNARPQFGAFANTGVLIAGTGQVTGASGPKTNATEGAGALANFYIVDFGNDVSLRFLQVTQFPTGGASTNRAAMAVDCGASASATTLCSTVAGVSDSSKNHVVVQFGSAGSGAADTSWEVAAISG
jgi:hypothetical protein